MMIKKVDEFDGDLNDVENIIEEQSNVMVVSTDLEERFEHVASILAERNEHIPYSFAIVMEMLGRSLGEVYDLDQYELIKEDMREFLTTIIDYHDTTPH